MARAFEALARERPEGRILVVTHGGVLSAIYRHIHGIPVSTAHPVAIPNASYNALAFAGGLWNVEAWADTAHLPEAPAFEDTLRAAAPGSTARTGPARGCIRSKRMS